MKRKRAMKKTTAALMAAVLAVGIGFSSNAASGSFTSSGGTTNVTWNYEFTSTLTGGAFYRLAASARQPRYYKFDDLNLKLTLYCNTGSNQVKDVSLQNAYEIDAHIDASTGVTGGKGYVVYNFSDDTYGKASKTVYN